MNNFASFAVLGAAMCLIGASPAKNSRASEIAEAKKSLKEAADQSFVAAWEKTASEPMPHPTASQTRKFALWYTPAYSLGMCRGRNDSGVLADWYSKLDTLDFSYGADPDHEKSRAMQVAKVQYDQGVREGGTASFCSIELSAVSEYLQEF